MNQKLIVSMIIFVLSVGVFIGGCKPKQAPQPSSGSTKKTEPAKKAEPSKKTEPAKKADSGKEATKIRFTGGPSGGTYEIFTNAASNFLSENLKNVKVFNQASKGSVENIRRVDSGKIDFGISYSGDIYLARNGKLAGDKVKYEKVRAVAFLYKAPAQLAVLKKSAFKSVKDLEGKKVAVGGQGSGAAASAERFFKTVGLWDKIDHQFLGYNKAAAAMKDGKVDAMWILAGPPTAALMNLATSHEIRLLDLYDYGVKKGLNKQHPYYQPVKLESAKLADKYKGMDKDIGSFFDSALWTAGVHVSEDVVYKALKALYTEKGLAYMQKAKKTFNQMKKADGLVGIVTPLHKGAAKFWKEQGLSIPKGAEAK